MLVLLRGFMKNIFSILFLFLVPVHVFSASHISDKWSIELEKSKGSVEFRATGWPSALKIHGKGVVPKGTFIVENLQLSGVSSFALESLDTGIKRRNEHMKNKYLEIKKYPLAVLTLSNTALPESFKQESVRLEKIPFAGRLLLHGVDQIISGFANIERKLNQINVEANFGFKISEFAISSPGFAGITMADRVEVQVQFSGPLTTVKSP
jgi:hypothetical protein